MEKKRYHIRKFLCTIAFTDFSTRLLIFPSNRVLLFPRRFSCPVPSPSTFGVPRNKFNLLTSQWTPCPRQEISFDTIFNDTSRNLTRSVSIPRCAHCAPTSYSTAPVCLCTPPRASLFDRSSFVHNLRNIPLATHSNYREQRSSVSFEPNETWIVRSVIE